jgi:hypothetical protein
MYYFLKPVSLALAAAVITAYALPSSNRAERQTTVTGTCDVATQTCNITQPADLAGLESAHPHIIWRNFC